jgi:hypothetical protein
VSCRRYPLEDLRGYREDGDAVRWLLEQSWLDRPRGCDMLRVMRVLVIAVILSWFATAEAGPYCWTEIGFSPDPNTKLPVSPSIAYGVQDGYYGGRQYKSASPPVLTATIDGKPAQISSTDVAVDGGIVRVIKIRSTATGKLELSRRFPHDKTPGLQATYTIVKDWSPGEPKLKVVPGKDNGLGPYRWQGDYAGLQVDVPALMFKVKWRATSRDGWQTLSLPAHVKDGRAEAWLGEETCGMRENIPLATLAKGIEIDVRALLPNNQELTITKVPLPLVFKPVDRAPKPQRATSPPPAD